MLNVAGELERKLSQRVVMLFSMHFTDGKINGNSIDANPRQKLDFNHIGLTYNIPINYLGRSAAKVAECF